uniref:CAAX prenyl protease 2/Lysostaphin resistance protein A-like domain-containing protein n=1 Tax=Dunaliella tertiolecta TaxID=3047 RepID=A0A7S3RA85_DUNTE|eukprot:CAMPEP_0202343050 /NCGR_PEP_ID=MMETSP1126-20121109/3344_1 /ASSEMBLY_ACC=CAM_ASM_000457 /TAXON_ID=3047 /ORGANISM="Dunaliella tertiolecta, Strain CCMP1320" /LENGTH=388 /DNA_ID=CAMNT_0048934077 /DNA_START=60 /DNA_END=1226 /DNA_ORIENTATION=-
MQAPVLHSPCSRISSHIQASSGRSIHALHFRFVEQHNGPIHSRHTTQCDATSQLAPAAASTSASVPVVTILHQSKPAAKWGRGGSTSTRPQESKRGKEGASGGGGKGDDDEEEEKWGILDWSRFEGWDVPWGGAATAGGMALWFGSFVAVGFLVVPGIYGALGIKLSELQDKSQYVLVTQATATLVGLSVIRLVTAGPMKEAGEPQSKKDKLFNYSLAEPFRKPYGWATWGLLGLALAPVLVGVLATLLSTVGYEDAVGGRGTVDGVAGMIQLDVPTYLSLLSITGVLAPLLEETVFRGFLLTSLTKWLPTWAALVLSSLAFGLCHLSLRDLPVLTALGMLLGSTYVRSRNLLSPILIHGVWNSAVLTFLFVLAQSGIDLNQAISELR